MIAKDRDIFNLQASLKEANEAAQQIEQLQRELQEGIANLAAHKAPINAFKFALTSIGATADNTQSSPRIGLFTLKPNSLVVYNGEKSLEKAYA